MGDRPTKARSSTATGSEPSSSEAESTDGHRSPSPPRGRYAPTPSGLIHLGNARTALVAWLSIRSQGGTFVWRLEDLDPPRSLEGAAEAALRDLEWLGLDWDEGPSQGGSYGPYVQSERASCYRNALRRLAEKDRLFPCRRSRKDLQNLATAPHGPYARDGDDNDGGAAGGMPPYPSAWRPENLERDWYDAYERASRNEAEDDEGKGKGKTARGPGAALRFRVDEGPVIFHDLLQGEVTQRVDREVGDFVLQRRDGLFAYQLAVVVDDLAMEITEVVRGVDLLDSTPRQIQLIEALDGELPRWAHLPMILDADGEKLSKRHGGLTLESLRGQGIAAPRIVGYLAASLGLLERAEPCRPEELVAHFDWKKIRLEDHCLPPEIEVDPAAILP